MASNLLKVRALSIDTMSSNRPGHSSSAPRVDGHRQQLAAARQDYVAAARHGRAGRDVQARYTAYIDSLVHQLAEGAREHSGAALSVCALGGYGRRSLCLHSDIDLLILFEEEIAPAEERFINALLQPLWDLGLSIGHHVREFAEFDEPDTGNTEFLLSLLDVRLIAGDERLFQRLGGWKPRAIRPASRPTRHTD